MKPRKLFQTIFGSILMVIGAAALVARLVLSFVGSEQADDPYRIFVECGVPIILVTAGWQIFRGKDVTIQITWPK